MFVKREDLFDDDLRAAVVEAYQAGEKLTSIERRFGVARATIYWFLEQAGVQPSRLYRKTAMSADKATVADLYDVILEQEQYIPSIEAELAEARRAIDRLQKQDHRRA